MTTQRFEDAGMSGSTRSNTPKDAEGAESEREKGLGPTSGSLSGLDALHGAPAGETVTAERLVELAMQTQTSLMKRVTIEDRLNFGVALVLQGYPASKAAFMANDIEDNDGALQMLARHRAKYQAETIGLRADVRAAEAQADRQAELARTYRQAQLTAEHKLRTMTASEEGHRKRIEVVEGERDKARADLAALTAGPQFFAVAGLVETDLKERYESLRASFDQARTYDDEARERASSLLRRRAAYGRIASEAPSGTSTDGERYGETVDEIAAVLGLQRAPIAPSET